MSYIPSSNSNHLQGQSYRAAAVVLSCYSALVLGLSLIQAGYINADFVAYATIAHRLLDGSGQAVSGCWSPLFSWLMIPFIYGGLHDLVAGRIVLICGGALYVLAALRLMQSLLADSPRLIREVLPAYSICVILQASIWATYLLDPDILADGILFLYFSIVVDRDLIRSVRGAIFAGLAAGFAYLAKAYMLPFVAIHFFATLLMHLRTSDRTGFTFNSVWSWVRTASLVVAAVMLVAGPWIAVLSRHYHRLLFSTAGTINYANMGPKQFGKDPLWNPGLTPDFLVDPHISSRWSPLESWASFTHQLEITSRNILNGFGHVFPWIILLAIGLILYVRSGRGQPHPYADPGVKRAVQWCVVSVILYYSGYWIIDNQARYIAPVVSPLLSLSALVLILNHKDNRGRFESGQVNRWIGCSASCLVILALLASSQDFDRIYRLATRHSQSARLDQWNNIAHRLSEAHVLPAAFAASEFHPGAYIAYAGNASRLYYGAPLAKENSALSAELNSTPVTVYIRLIKPEYEERLGRKLPGIPDGWELAMYFREDIIRPMAVEVYKRRQRLP